MELVVFLKLCFSDLFAKKHGIYDLDRHLDAAIEWLCRAHDLSPDNGVSYGYSIQGGWRDSYRETSGYIATTFFNLAKEKQDSRFYNRAIDICHWLCSVQNTDGSFSNPKYSPDEGIVFDTGQDLFGLVRAYQETGDEKFIDAAVLAGNWLVTIADDTGRWTRNTHLGIPHTYNTRSAWALLQLNEIRPSSDTLTVARANLDFAVSQEKDGYFDQCAFEENVAPFTHTIAYAIRGLWESSVILVDKRYAEAAIRAARQMTFHVQENGFIAGQIDRKGISKYRYCCLTGNAQLAIVWSKIYQQTKEDIFIDSAISALKYVMSYQDIKTTNPDIRGAIKGSQPIWGRYSRLTFPNWPTKFYIDALLSCRRWL